MLEPKGSLLRLKNNRRVYTFFEVTEQQFEQVWQECLPLSQFGLEGFRLLMSRETTLTIKSPESWEVVEPGKPARHLRLVHDRKETDK